MRRILIIAPSWLGDIIMSQCLLKLLKKRDPSCRIDVYAPAYAHPIIRRMPEADGIIENPFAHHEFAFIKRRREGIKLRAARYDEAYILPNSWKSALVPFFARIPLRIGFKGESRYLLINSMRSNKKDYPRMADRYAALAWPLDQVTSSATLPAYEFPALKTLPPSEELLARLKITPGRPMLALGCGANYGPAKLWPVEYFARVCDWWTGRGGQVLALGSKKDIPAFAYICKDITRSNDEIEKFRDRERNNDFDRDKLFDTISTSGIFILISTRHIPTTEILPTYYSRQQVEQLFDIEKNYSNLVPLRVQTEETLRGHLLLVFIVSTLIKMLQEDLRDTEDTPMNLFLNLRNQKCKVYNTTIITAEPVKKVNDIYKKFYITCPPKFRLNGNRIEGDTRFVKQNKRKRPYNRRKTTK